MSAVISGSRAVITACTANASFEVMSHVSFGNHVAFSQTPVAHLREASVIRSGLCADDVTPNSTAPTATTPTEFRACFFLKKRAATGRLWTRRPNARGNYSMCCERKKIQKTKGLLRPKYFFRRPRPHPTWKSVRNEIKSDPAVCSQSRRTSTFTLFGVGSRGRRREVATKLGAGNNVTGPVNSRVATRTRPQAIGNELYDNSYGRKKILRDMLSG